MLARLTIKWLKRTPPSTRLLIAAWLFWGSVLGGILSTILFANGFFERIVMAISWGAITITAVDIIQSSDVRDELGDTS